MNRRILRLADVLTLFNANAFGFGSRDSAADAKMLYASMSIPINSLCWTFTVPAVFRSGYRNERQQHERDEQDDEKDRKFSIVRKPWTVPTIETLKKRHQNCHHHKKMVTNLRSRLIH